MHISGVETSASFFSEYDSEGAEDDSDLTKSELEVLHTLKTSTITDQQGACNTTSVLSPRTNYIDGCLRNGLFPRASCIVRQSSTIHSEPGTSTTLQLSHQGIGDKMAAVLAGSLPDLPLVQTLDLRDNRLSDAGLHLLLKSLSVMSSLTDIKLSQNVVGPRSTASLLSFIESPTCKLVSITLSSISADDDWVALFVKALRASRVIKSVDLSNNQIGGSLAMSRGVDPAAQASDGLPLADYVGSSTCSLSTLRLSWNMLSSQQAVAFCKALAHNKSLTYLDLSYNALGHDGGEALGDAMLDNRSLRTLLLAHNGIDSTACFTICAGILENLALRHVCLDGNPIGERGAKALMLVPVVAGSRVRVTANNCNISLKDSKCFFDPGEPCGTYALHLDRPFERAIVFKMLEIVASHNAYVFRRFAYEEAPGTSSNKAKKKAKQPKPVDLQLIQVVGDFICLIRSVIA